MIGTQLLQLLQGDPSAQLGQTLNPPPGGPQPSAGGPPAPPTPTAPPAPTAPPLPPPAATQSPADLAPMYQQLMQLHSQDVRGAGIDRGLGLMASAFGTAQQQHDMMNYAAQTPQDDRLKAMGAAITDTGALREQQNAAQFQAGAAGLANQFNTTPEVMTELARDPQAMAQFMTGRLNVQNQMQEEKNKDLVEAQSKAPGAITTMQDMDQRASGIQNAIDPATGNPVMQGILNSSRKQWAAKKIIEAKDDAGWLSSAEGTLAQSMLTPAEQAAVSNLKQLNNQVYSEAFTSTGSRRTQTEVANLRAGISPLLNFNQSYNDYMKQYGDFQKTLHTGIANTYGAAQDLDNPALAPYRNLVNPEYLPAQRDEKGNQTRAAGPLYAGGGGAWASEPGFKSGEPTQVAGGFNQASYDKLPSGATYTAPDGTQRTKR